MHSPEHAQEVQEARRLGGLRRKREATLTGAYDFEGLDTVSGIRRLIHVAALDTMGMENSISRNRTLAYLAQVALRTLEVGDLEQRIIALELTVQSQTDHGSETSFDMEPELTEAGKGEAK
ncbi:hypothetical protein ACFLUN_00790 [Chloroflexota bacterium]